MNSIVKNRYIDTLLKLMLLSAVIHMIVLAVYSVSNNDFTSFNFFTIVGLDLLFPQIVANDCQYLYSFVTVLCLYILLYYFLNSKNKKS